MVVFDDVVVPTERVFAQGELDRAASWRESFETWERFLTLGRLVDVADALAGLAHLVAEANGLSEVAHIREKIGNMTVFAAVLAATLEGAINGATGSPDGTVVPAGLFTGAGRFHAAERFHAVVRDLHDVAGGSVVTAPSLANLNDADVGPLVAKYMRTMEGADAQHRIRLFHAIRDFTADAYAGWRALTVLGDGGLDGHRALTVSH